MKTWNGTMMITTVNRESFSLTGAWEYSEEHDCWYLDGESFPAEICRKVD